MRHIGFPQVGGGQRDPRDWGFTLETWTYTLQVFSNVNLTMVKFDIYKNGLDL